MRKAWKVESQTTLAHTHIHIYIYVCVCVCVCVRTCVCEWCMHIYIWMKEIRLLSFLGIILIFISSAIVQDFCWRFRINSAFFLKSDIFFEIIFSFNKICWHRFIYLSMSVYISNSSWLILMACQPVWGYFIPRSWVSLFNEISA